MRAWIMIVMLLASAPAWGMEIPDAGSPGARAFAARCGACHALPHPKRLDWPRWRRMLGLMRQRMAERGVPAPSKEEWRQIAAYLKRHAR